jgi:hypothetical protein
MSLFHRHKWREVRRYYAEPIYEIEGPFRIRGAGGMDRLERMMHGHTVVELRCEECGDVSSRHLRGDATHA